MRAQTSDHGPVPARAMRVMSFARVLAGIFDNALVGNNLFLSIANKMGRRKCARPQTHER